MNLGGGGGGGGISWRDVFTLLLHMGGGGIRCSNRGISLFLLISQPPDQIFQIRLQHQIPENNSYLIGEL